MTLYTHLGKNSAYASNYDNSLLTQIERNLGRKELSLNPNAPLPFNGFDLWNCYELSWLNQNGRPEVRLLSFIIPATSKYMPESKSVKLYLNSFNQTKFTNEKDVLNTIEDDLSSKLETIAEVQIYELEELAGKLLAPFDGINIDKLDVKIEDYKLNPELLKLDHSQENITETLYSNLLKSNCLVTNQPDFASLQIKYSGTKINHESFLKYIISFRNHNEFHEQCAERIFCDIMARCSPQSLTVHAKFTRRGGVDINPIRSNLVLKVTDIDKLRDIRQ